VVIAPLNLAGNRQDHLTTTHEKPGLSFSPGFLLRAITALKRKRPAEMAGQVFSEVS
jgi:hypothetical protein